MEHDTKAEKLANPVPAGQLVQAVLIRHAQSQWNRENRFTGWADPMLTEAGIAEAIAAGDSLRAQGFHFDFAYSSRLQRAIGTLDILLDRLGQPDLPSRRDWRLNERHYGALQGMDKDEATTRAGAHQVLRWRRGYLDKAEALPREHASHPVHDARYADVDPAQLPDVENLDDTRRRVAAFWRDEMLPRIRRGERVLVSAHGNTLRALLMDLSGMSVAEVESFEIPTATPIVYIFSKSGRPLHWHYLERNAELPKIA